MLSWCLEHSPNRTIYRRVGFRRLPEIARPIELHFGVRALNAPPDAALGNRRNWYLSYLGLGHGLMAGHFVVSLDFELHWGIRDHTPVDAVRDRLIGVRRAIPAILALFRERGIRASWAVVGLLCANDRDEIEATLPRVRPRYRDPLLDPYPAIAEIGSGEDDDPFHYAPSLVQAIAETPGQDIGTHTYAHTYGLEPGVDLDAFVADLDGGARDHGAAGAHAAVDRVPAQPVRARSGAGALRARDRGLPGGRARPVPPRARRDRDGGAAGGAVHRQRGAVAERSRAAGAVSRGAGGRRAREPVFAPRGGGAGRLCPRSGAAAPHRAIHDGGRANGPRLPPVVAPAQHGRDVQKNLDLLARILDHYGALSHRHGFVSAHMVDRAEAVLGGGAGVAIA